MRQFNSIALAFTAIGLAAMPAPAGSISLPSFELYFPDSSGTLDTHAVQVIKAAASLHKSDCPRQHLYVFASTDTVGTATDNLKRSATYADIVAKELVVAGVPSSLIVRRPTGETLLPVRTPDETDEPINRRVHIAFGEDNLFQECNPPLTYPSN